MCRVYGESNNGLEDRIASDLSGRPIARGRGNFHVDVGQHVRVRGSAASDRTQRYAKIATDVDEEAQSGERLHNKVSLGQRIMIAAGEGEMNAEHKSEGEADAADQHLDGHAPNEVGHEGDQWVRAVGVGRNKSGLRLAVIVEHAGRHERQCAVRHGERPHG